MSQRVVRTLIVVAVLAILPVETRTFSPAPTEPTQALTNGDVVALIKAGLSPALVIRKVETSECAFVLGPTELIELKEQQVPDAVIEAMLSASAAPRRAEAPLPPPNRKGSARASTFESIPVGRTVAVKELSPGTYQIKDTKFQANVFSPLCAQTIRHFRAVIGFEATAPDVCNFSYVLEVESTGKQMFPYEAFVRTRDNAIEFTRAASATPTWENQITGKRLKLSIMNGSIVFEDLTPEIPLTRIVRGRGHLKSNLTTTRTSAAGQSTISALRFEPKPDAELAVFPDPDHIEMPGSHGHALGKCEGRITFDGRGFNFRSTEKPEHSSRFELSDVRLAWVSMQGNGALEEMSTGKKQGYSVRGDWEALFDVIIDKLTGAASPRR